MFESGIKRFETASVYPGKKDTVISPVDFPCCDPFTFVFKIYATSVLNFLNSD